MKIALTRTRTTRLFEAQTALTEVQLQSTQTSRMKKRNSATIMPFRQQQGQCVQLALIAESTLVLGDAKEMRIKSRFNRMRVLNLVMTMKKFNLKIQNGGNICQVSSVLAWLVYLLKKRLRQSQHKCLKPRVSTKIVTTHLKKFRLIFVTMVGKQVPYRQSKLLSLIIFAVNKRKGHI